jgi:hypothetical protein
MYGPDLVQPITAVMVEGEINVTIEEAVAEQRILPGGYVVCDVFEAPDDGNGNETRVMRATLEAMRRQAERAELEGYAAMLYHYDASCLERCSTFGVITATIPAPLDAETIIDVFEQLAHHPRYQHQLVVGISQDEQIVTMRDGTAKITTEAPE